MVNVKGPNISAREGLSGRGGLQSAATPDDRFAWLLAPPAVLGAVFIILFGVGIIDSFVSDGADRLRSQLVFYRGLSLAPVLYLIVAYGCFWAGYATRPVAAVFRRFRPARRRWDAARATVVTTSSFLLTFGVLVAYTVQVGYGRFEGSGNAALENLSLLGELSLVPCAFSLVRYFQRRSGSRAQRMSRWDRVFLWAFMLPAQVILSVVIGTRSRVVTFIVVALAAYHYCAKRLRPRTVMVAGVLTLAVVVPQLGSLRATDGEEFSLQAGWASIARRTSAIESLTIIYENLDTAPEPDPIYWTLVTGLVPRFLWPGKPQSLATERLTYWAVGQRGRWAGPTLPGEFLMLFGHVGGLLAMVLLGVSWRLLSEIARVEENSPWVALYIVALPTLLTAEVGFISPYSVLTRFMVIAIVLLFASTRLTKARAIQRSGVVLSAPNLRPPLLTAGVAGAIVRER